MKFGLVFIKNHPLLSAVIMVLALHIATLIPGDVWVVLLFMVAFAIGVLLDRFFV